MKIYMRKQNKATMIKLIIMMAIMIVLAFFVSKYAKNLIQEVKLQDLRTNMLYIQVEAKKSLEEFCFQTVNMDKSKQEELDKINQIKQEKLCGILLNNTSEDIQNAIQVIPDITIDDSYYYIDEEALKSIGINDTNIEENGYFFIKYDFDNINVEVINTKGYQGNYTLTQLNELIGE